MTIPNQEDMTDPGMSSSKVVYAKINKPPRGPPPDVPSIEINNDLSTSSECLILSSSSDKVVYAELTGLPSAKSTKFNKPSDQDNDKVIYSDVKTALSNDPDKVLYADLGSFPTSKPSTEKVEKVIYSEIGSIKPKL